MRIIAASISQAADTFLHAGYISAYPRSLYPESYGYSEPTLQIEVAEALRLKGETIAANTTMVDSSSIATGAGSPEWWTLLCYTICFFMALGLVYWLRKRMTNTFRPWAFGATATTVVVGLMVFHCEGREPLPTEAPWKGVQLQEYQNPEAATQVLLHGIIADGIANIGQPISTLANIQNEVGLPAKKLTEGQVYALKTYGIDGWGTEFRLTNNGKEYVVTSAGSDKAFDTADDLSLNITQYSNSDWDTRYRTFFLRKDAGSPLVLFHRWTGDFFRYKNQVKAQEVTGTNLFDLFLSQDMNQEILAKVEKSYNEVTHGLTYDPMVLQVFTAAH